MAARPAVLPPATTLPFPRATAHVPSVGYDPTRTNGRDRAVSLAAVAGLHALAVYLLIALPPQSHTPGVIDALDTFDVAVPRPPSPAAKPAEARAPEAEGRAAPHNLRASPSEVVAPTPVVALPPPPLAAAPIAGTGAEAAVGAAERPGPGTGAGGFGTGLGSGGTGDGTGGGGGGTRAKLLRGTIRNADYPKAARRARIEGVVTAQFTVGTDGRARNCAVARSSGNAELDATTCRLIEQRYIYAPARNAGGEPVSELRAWQQRWWIEGPRGD